MGIYELAILGGVSDDDRATLSRTIERIVSEFDLNLHSDVVILDETNIRSRDRRAAFAAAWFEGPGDVAVARDLIAASAPVIPTVQAGGDFIRDIPGELHFANGLRRRASDPEMVELASAMLECVGLLRRQRRAFVSYRRTESRAVAVQLHDLLCARAFDVFLDTHDIRPGEPFQDVLWHRLCDSDVMVMLDTPTYFDSKWTRNEIGRARAKEIHVLRIVWPGHSPAKSAGLAQDVLLDPDDLEGSDGPLASAVADNIIANVERLRSKSIASRFMSITGRLRIEVEKIGGAINGVGAHRAVSLRLPDDRQVWAYPVVGIPTAELLYDVSVKALRADQIATPVLIYDHVGIGETWNAHLSWLEKHIRTVRAVKVFEAGWAFAAWED
jgi:hypothetical protein